MFSQADPNQERTEGGLGIGLALVKGLVKLHGGCIDARSEGLERGSEFTVVLPCIPAQRGMHPQISPTEAAVPKNSVAVLVADDNRDGAESLAMLLEYSGHRVRVAHSGLDALEMARQHLPRVAILDIGMPGLNGYEVATQIRSQAWGSHITLIAMTGWDRRKTGDAPMTQVSITI